MHLPRLVVPCGYHCWPSTICPRFPQKKPAEVPSCLQGTCLHCLCLFHLELYQSHMGSSPHYVTGDYYSLSSVGWSTLEDFRREVDLTLFYKIVKGEIVVSSSNFHLELTDRRTRSIAHSPVIKDWNALAASVVDADLSGCFKARLVRRRPQAD